VDKSTRETWRCAKTGALEPLFYFLNLDMR
jgi:hypothetical protein